MFHCGDFFIIEPANHGISAFVDRGIGFCDSEPGARQWPHAFDSVEFEPERDITIRIQRHRMNQSGHVETPWEIFLELCDPGEMR